MAQVANVLSTPRALRLFQRKQVKGVCVASDLVGNLVYIQGPLVSEAYSVRTADPADPEKMPAVGIITAKKSATSCTFLVFGEIRIPGTSLIPGRTAYVGTDGRLTQVRPTEGIRQPIGEALSEDTLFFNPSSGAGCGTRLYDRPLSGEKNNYNAVFYTQYRFLPDTIVVYHNGRRLTYAYSGSVTSGDFTAAESSGTGTGFDTVVFLSLRPRSSSHITADYDVEL